MQIPLITLKAQYETIKNKIDKKAPEVLSGAQYIKGTKVKTCFYGMVWFGLMMKNDFKNAILKECTL